VSSLDIYQPLDQALEVEKNITGGMLPLVTGSLHVTSRDMLVMVLISHLEKRDLDGWYVHLPLAIC
jgi:hypothetical protein